MMKYEKPVLDIVEVDEADAIFTSGEPVLPVSPGCPPDDPVDIQF